MFHHFQDKAMIQEEALFDTAKKYDCQCGGVSNLDAKCHPFRLRA